MKSDQEIIKAVCERMYQRRQREATALRAKFTMSYAVSVKSGHCYVGYNMDELTKSTRGNGKCAENRAAYVAASYGEKLEELVFFALNDNSELYNACPDCQTWVCNARGFMKNQNQLWMISTVRPPNWTDYPLTKAERETLYNAGEKVISETSQQYFSTVNF
jgi:cytidine deaminase